jgi:acyl carrier protein
VKVPLISGPSETLSRVSPIVARFARDKEALAQKGADARFKEDLGISSANVIDIVLDLEDTFGVTIDDEEIKLIPSVGAAADLIDAKLVRAR